MTLPTTETPATSLPSRQRASNRSLAAVRLSGLGIIRSELLKLFTLRSTWWCLGVLTLLLIGLPLLAAASVSSLPADAANNDPELNFYNWTQQLTFPLGFGVLVAAVLGCLVITSEYGTGMIRSSLVAAPTRLSTLFAKTVVIGGVIVVVGFLSLTLTAISTRPLLEPKGYEIDLFDGRLWLTLVSAAGYLTLIAMFAVGFGAMLRSSAGAIATVLALLLVVPTVLQLFSFLLSEVTWPSNVIVFLPSSLGDTMYLPAMSEMGGFLTPATITLSQGQAALLLVGWVVVTLFGAAVLMRRRDV